MTVSSFTSVSVTPPVVMVSLSREARSHHLIERARIFGVSILSESQKAAAQCFSGLECEDDRRFEGVAMHTLVTGAPLISGGLAYLDCTLVDTYAVGTNTLFFGEVVATQIGAAGQPLLYFDRDYRAIQGKVQP
jgi:flavin reductase (DIM6/NTAB) family NADH-FMN oxidoreductase RutF